MDPTLQIPAAQVAPRLPLHQRLSYGVGHVLNDLCASMWFSYLLVYFHKVQSFTNVMAGMLLLVGQIADALSTPFVGLEIDRTRGFCGYGKRKSWHLVGSLCAGVTFPFIFINCITCEDSADWAKFIYYAPFIVIFQFGWAATQISHLSLIPDLTPCMNERTGLNAIRYAFTVISNCSVYAITFLVLNQSSSGSDQKLTKEDAPNFLIIALTVVGIGSLFTLIFHIGTKEKSCMNLAGPQNGTGPANNANNSNHGSSGKIVCHMVWREWFKELQFYQVALLYMCTRLVVNISQIYMPMYLTDTLNADKDQIAIVPFVIYLSGFTSSFAMKPLNRYAGRKVTYFIGIIVIVGVSVWFKFVTVSNRMMVYAPAVFQGIGTTTLLITSLSMTADLIGDHVESGAFVYGAMSFTDKLSNGAAVMLIQKLNPCVGCCVHCSEYYRNILVFVPGSVALASLLVLLTLIPQNVGILKKDKMFAEIADRESLNYETIGDENSPLLANAHTDQTLVSSQLRNGRVHVTAQQNSHQANSFPS